MNVEIGTAEAAQFPVKEYIRGIFVAVWIRWWKRACLMPRGVEHVVLAVEWIRVGGAQHRAYVYALTQSSTMGSDNFNLKKLK
jgi:hypothetical protein